MTEADFDRIAHETDGYNGSDLLSVSRQAAMGPVREGLEQTMDCGEQMMESSSASDEGMDSSHAASASMGLRPVALRDYEVALTAVKPTPY